jgi:hypothetical protein
MNLKVMFDQSVSTLPVSFVAAVNYVVNYFDSLFTENVTINIDLGYGEIDGQLSPEMPSAKANPIWLLPSICKP